MIESLKEPDTQIFRFKEPRQKLRFYRIIVKGLMISLTSGVRRLNTINRILR